MSKLFIGLIAVSFLILAACTPQPVPVEPAVAVDQAEDGAADAAAEPQTDAADSQTSSTEATEDVGSYQEAPMLTEMVTAGDLPAIEERLPIEPFIVGPGVIVGETELPDWQPGQYGGTLQTAHGDPEWNPDLFIMLNEPLLMAPGIGVDGIRGNVFRDFEVDDNNQIFTFYMREGLRWSDGEPVTTEDVRFVYEDIYLNEDITPAFPARYRAAGRPDGEPMTLDIIDDYTFRVSFAEPYGGFLRELTIKGWQGYTELLRPAHHLKQYHTNYTPIEDLQPLMEEQGLTDEWWNLFNQKDCTNWEVTSSTCAGYPSLTPWLLIESQPETMHFVRNPYYFKVDTEGQQLPYIDELISVQVGDVEAVNLRVFTGEVDFLREDTALVKLPLYKENEEKGNYRVHLLDTHVDPTALILNYNYDDPTWQEVISNVDFRRALNMAIKRQEIIESVYFGLASLPETTPGEYDPEAANQLLDEIGMTERDADGFRLGPDGETFVIPIETGGGAPDLVPVTELLIEHFKEIGIKTTLKQIDPTLFGQRAEANELQATVFWSVQPMWGDGTWTDYVPDDRWGPLWRVWYNSNGEEGVEPPDEVKQLYDIYEGRIQAIPSSEEDAALREQLYSLYNENLFFLNIVEKVKYAMIADADLGNIQSAGQAIGADNSGEQFFFKQ